MSGNLTALQTLWATYPATMSTSDKLAAVNSAAVAGPPQDVSRTAIRNILIGAGALAPMQAYIKNPSATQPCLTATDYLVSLVGYEAGFGDTLKTSDPANLTMIQTLAPDLISDPANGMTADVLARITALITPPIQWWQANGFSGPVLVSDLIAAGNLF